MDKLLKTYLLRSEVSVSNSSASNSIALQLLNSGRSSTNILSVLL